jgi:4-hydroxybenzoate polyprenyltransferase
MSLVPPNGPVRPNEKAIVRFLRLIRFSHTIFALPFALGALLVATGGRPSWRLLAPVLLCMVCARTAAMLFNRIADWTLDQRNPRTAARHRLLSRRAAIWLLIFSSAAFVASAGAINRMTLLLSPIALVIVFFYSTTKRFTAASHFFLGLALAVAPAGAWIAATGRLELAPLILGAGVIAWVAGFDLIYAIQDLEFDRREGLHSLAVRLGIPGSLRIAQYLHVVMFLALLGFGFAASLGRNYFVGMPLIAGALIYEHWSARRLDIAGINRAFFQSNAFVSAVFLVCAAAGATQAPS